MSTTPQIIDHGITTTCVKCRHTDNIDLFICTPITGDLPNGHYQCPSNVCKFAWAIRSTPATSKRMEIVAISSVL